MAARPAAQKAERLFAVFDEPPYGTSMPGAGAESLRSLRRNIFGRYRGIADIESSACLCMSFQFGRASIRDDV
jgi:hypothetical protein